MRRHRLLAALAAVLLATVGGVLVLGYVGAADQRALAGVRTVPVLVVTEPVPAGTTAAELGELVEMRTLPAMAVAAGTVSDPGQLSGLVAETTLHPGEQVMAGRFVSPDELTAAGRPEVPEGLQQVSVLLETQRVLGGHLLPGDTVGVFLTPDDERERSRLVLDQVLITRVQGGLAAPEPSTQTSLEDGETPEPAAVPEGGVLVTLALAAEDAERVVLTAERGGIWLSLQDQATDPADGDVTDLEEVLR